MSNLFVTLPLPAFNGVGAAVDISAMGSPKTLVSAISSGEFDGATVTIEASVDGGVVYAPVALFQGGRNTRVVPFAAQFVRAKVAGRSGQVPFTATVSVGGSPGGAKFAAIAMPAGNGAGAATDISTFGSTATFIVGGELDGARVLVEVSDDGAAWAPLTQFSGRGGISTVPVTALYARANVSGRNPAVPFTATLAVGACNDAHAAPYPLCGTLTAAEINAAIAALSAAGGGVLALCPDVYAGFTESIRLMDGVYLDGQGSTLIKDPTAPAFRLIINDDPIAGNEMIGVMNITLDGARTNATTPQPWQTGTAYALGALVFNQTEATIYIAVQGGVSAGPIPSGVGDGIVDGTVIWDYLTPLWIPGADLLYFTRTRNELLWNVTFQNSPDNGAILEGSGDINGEDLGNLAQVIGCRFQDCNKAGLYCSSMERVQIVACTGQRCFISLDLACTWYSSIVGCLTRDNIYAQGIAFGRDTRYCTIQGNVLDGFNAVVEAISSYPLTIHGKLYPNPFAVVATPNTVGATTYIYWVVARDAGGQVIGVSTTASGTILNGNAVPDNTIDWDAVAGAATYDVLKQVAGYPELIVSQAGTIYNDVGAATTPYDYAEAYTFWGFSDCVISDNVITGGVIALRKADRNILCNNMLRDPGTAPIVSAVHGITLSGCVENHVWGNRINYGDDSVGVANAIGCEEYTDPSFSEDLFSNTNLIEHNLVSDDRAAPLAFAIGIAPGSVRNVVRRNWANVPNDFNGADVIAYENTGPDWTNGFAKFTVAAQAGTVIEVAIELPVFGESMVRVWLSDTDRGAPTAVPPDGGFTTTTGTDIFEYTVDVMRDIQSDATGQIVVEIDESTAKSFYLCIAIPNGRTVAQIVTFV